MSEERKVYSIQRTYIIKLLPKSEKRILTCDERIDIPTIEPLTNRKAVVYSSKFSKIIPCIELSGNFLSEFKLEFETNEGVTVLPIEIDPGPSNPLDNPYMSFRYVLVLPRGATGVKSCKITHKATGKEVQHNLTFGMMSPPYNYDNALFGIVSSRVEDNSNSITALENKTDALDGRVEDNSNSITALENKTNALDGRVDALEDKTRKLKLITSTPYFPSKQLPKGAGRQTINIEKGMLYFNTYLVFNDSGGNRPLNLTITLNDGTTDKSYKLTLTNSPEDVLVDLVAGGIFAYKTTTGEVLKELRISPMPNTYKTISYEGFDNILMEKLIVEISGREIA